MGALNLLVTLAAAAGAQAAAPPPAAEAAIPIPPVRVSPPRSRVVPPALISPPPPVLVPPPRAEVYGQTEIAELGDSDDTLAFSRSGAWHIRIDTSLSGGCYIAGFFENHTFIRVVNDPVSKTFSFGIGNILWRSLEDGDHKPLHVYIGSNEGWNGDGLIGRIGPVPFLFLTIPDAAFLNEMMDSRLLNVSSEGRNLGSYTYSGFDTAMDELVRCQQTVEHAVDPFSTPPAPAPFDRGKAN